MHYIPRRALFAGAGILLLTTNAMGAYVELIDTSDNEEYHTYAIEIDAPKGADGSIYPYGCVATGRPGIVVKCDEQTKPSYDKVISWHGEGHFLSKTNRVDFWGPIKLKIVLQVIDNRSYMGWHGLLTELRATNPVDITITSATYVEHKFTASGVFYTPDATKPSENGNMRFRVADQITLRSGGTQTLIDDVTGRGMGQVMFGYEGTLPPEFTCMGENGTRDGYVLKEGSVVKCTYQGKGVGVTKGNMRVVVGLK
ncbi:hypothetical protein IB394_005209 [Escherichia coli]|nr:hypothetical protein [Escherichia coli]EFI5594857.1 hypothetical protein [Escherichia coli]EFI6096243.1 hypothetical protein [Escherichia coli]EFI8984899.1 hypothetical protein [Escherichia coli]EFJ0493229.1 hypothetical protein [Escherichia coli]